VTLRDRIRSLDMVSEFKNGRNKNTYLTVTSENLSSVGQIVGNFIAKNFKIFDGPVVSYRISFSFLHRLSSLDLIESCPSEDPLFLDYFLNATHSLVNERKMNSDAFLAPQVVINDLHEKNFKLFILCVLGDKSKMYPRNYNVLNFYEKMIILLNSKDCSFWNSTSQPPQKFDSTVDRTTGFNHKRSPILAKYSGR